MTTVTSPRASPSSFELLITCNPPIFESLLAQIPTETILNLFHTSAYLQQFLRSSPTSWRYLSWRIYQPVVAPAPGQTAAATTAVTRQSSSYPLDRLMFYVINPFSTRLVSLELDNTSVSGGILSQTVLVQRRDTLQHLSVRGCKNVSLKYHINPWLQMHALARDVPDNSRPADFDNLALKSLYTYRCRHHRRRPYLPSSLSRKESDSEPTHELVNICHKLGIWTDTAWCTTPGTRCFRRRGYVTMRLPQDPREVWVVFDRLWRSRNWLGPVEQTSQDITTQSSRKRKRDARVWESDEYAMNGEPLGTTGEGKAVPTHLRKSHRQFVDNVTCHNCSTPILERCEQCSVMMHCSGCRKTLCASCAFDRPYLRNANATQEEKQRFWWAPGSAVSPCSMQDHDPTTPVMNPNPVPNGGLALPSIKFRWCCTEPVFSGGGGITFGNGASRETDRVRAAPLPKNQGWEDSEFAADHLLDMCHAQDVPEQACVNQPEGLSVVDNIFHAHETLSQLEQTNATIPRLLCDECFTTDHWRIRCKACSVSICLRHDVCERLKVRVCGYKDLQQEKQEYSSRQKALRWLQSLVSEDNDAHLLPGLRQLKLSGWKVKTANQSGSVDEIVPYPANSARSLAEEIIHAVPRDFANADVANLVTEVESFLDNLTRSAVDSEPHPRPLSRGSNSTGPPSRSSSPTPSINSQTTTPEPSAGVDKLLESNPSFTRWSGCQAFFCPAVRAAGDHRRRCVATIRSCAGCKVNICSDCVSGLEPPCPCQGCRLEQAQGEDDSSASTSPTDNARFFCPNCRWERMQTGKCRIHSRAFLTAQVQAAKRRKRRIKNKKPLEARSTGQNTNMPLGGASDEAVEGLAEFFSQLNAQLSSSPPSSNVYSIGAAGLNGDGSSGAVDDIQQLEDMGALARDLILRIQHLREQFHPDIQSLPASPILQVDHEVGSQHGAIDGATEGATNGAMNNGNEEVNVVHSELEPAHVQADNHDNNENNTNEDNDDEEEITGLEFDITGAVNMESDDGDGDEH